MENKPSKKISQFLKKEGFYVILFLGLCIMAAVATITFKNNKQVKKDPVENNVVQNKINKGDIQVAEKSRKGYDNALEVKKEDSAKEKKDETKNKETAQVANQQKSSFVNPVQGKVARVYSEDPVFWQSTSTYRSNLGMDIKASIGTSVLAVADGKIEDVVTSSQDGVKVIINHQNGLKTIYANLNPKVVVKKGQIIKQGQQIGKVGKTTLRAAYEKYGDHLHFAMMKGSNYINPSKYIKY